MVYQLASEGVVILEFPITEIQKNHLRYSEECSCPFLLILSSREKVVCSHITVAPTFVSTCGYHIKDLFTFRD
jgi:hypothetical protein